jgi:aryl-alcohol dehydrogenase-like predicted oxidoreductase
MGGFRATISDAEAVQLTNDGYDAGIRYFDTSPFYGYGRSELRMGAALREKPRDSYVLSTKIGRVMHVRKPGEAAGISARTACRASRRSRLHLRRRHALAGALAHEAGHREDRHRADPRRRFLTIGTAPCS